MTALPLSKRRIFIACAAFAIAAAGLFFYWQSRVKPPAPQLVHFGQLTLERTACLGSCPVYMVMVTRDGQVTYRARQISFAQDGQIVGTPILRHGRMPSEILAALTTAIESPEYAALDSDYDLHVTDIPNTSIEISGKGASNRTTVSAIPCKKDASKDLLYSRKSDRSPPVPDVFCRVVEMVDIGSCARYWGQSTRVLVAKNDRPLPTPQRCKVAP